MLNPDDFRKFIIRPTLVCLDGLGIPKTKAAEELLVGTALVESHLSRLVQSGFEDDNYLDGGLSVYQIERATLVDVYVNFLKFRPELRDGIDALTLWRPNEGDAINRDFDALAFQTIWNLAYATIIARLIYWRAPEALPAAGDCDALGHYWKDHYNTKLGKGSPDAFTVRLISCLKRSRLE